MPSCGMLSAMNIRPAALALALDIPSADDLLPILTRLPPELHWCKVGLELFCAAGPAIVVSLRNQGKLVFLDLKLHDIPRTVQRAVQAAARSGVGLMTVHAGGGRAMLQAAVEAARTTGDGSTRIVAVTALTSLSEADLRDVGVSGSMTDHVLRLGEMAISAGVDGLVCSPLEVKPLRARLGPAPLLVTPGVRSASEALGDQKRTATAAEAVAHGADLLVVGRPIMEAADPGAATRGLLAEIAAANLRRSSGPVV